MTTNKNDETNESINVQFRIDSQLLQQMDNVVQQLEGHVARVSRAMFIQSAVEHYLDYLADMYNDGKKWGTDKPTTGTPQAQDLAGRTRGIRLPAQWARVATLRKPTEVWLCAESSHNLIDTGRIDVGALEDPGQYSSLTHVLHRAGYEKDPSRERRETTNGEFLIPIQPSY